MKNDQFNTPDGPGIVINKLINYYNYTSYLEIGVLNKFTFNAINCKNKIGVDPNGNTTHKCTSDYFFENIAGDSIWDIIFIDGDHSKEQVFKDVKNSLGHLSKNGVIVCHDVCPPTPIHLAERNCNNAWEAFAEFRQTRTDLEMYVVDMVCGCGVIRKGTQPVYEGIIESGWNFFNTNKKELLNLIPVDEFLNKYD